MNLDLSKLSFKKKEQQALFMDDADSSDADRSNYQKNYKCNNIHVQGITLLPFF